VDAYRLLARTWADKRQPPANALAMCGHGLCGAAGRTPKQRSLIVGSGPADHWCGRQPGPVLRHL